MWVIGEEMKVADVKPNQVTIFILLKCLGSYSGQAEITMTMDLVGTMDEPMDEVLLSSMGEAIVSNGDTEGAFDLTHQTPEDEHCRDFLNSGIYCSVLKGFTRERKWIAPWQFTTIPLLCTTH